MRKNFGSKTWLFPMPVLIVAAYDEEEHPYAMNAAWGGIYSDNRIGICMGENHKTTDIIRHSKAFTVSPGTEKMLKACDYVGIESANKVENKFEKAGFHHTKSIFVHAPVIDELPMALECELVSYDEESNFMIGEIVNVSAEESILNEHGKIDPLKMKPLIFDTFNHDYLSIGKKVGNAFEDGKELK